MAKVRNYRALSVIVYYPLSKKEKSEMITLLGEVDGKNSHNHAGIGGKAD